MCLKQKYRLPLACLSSCFLSVQINDRLLKERNWKLFAEEKAKPPINEYLQFLASSLHKQDSNVFCIHNKHATNTSCIDRVFLRSIEETKSQVPSKWLDTISLTDSRKDP